MADVFLLIVGWLHAIAAVAWVGGGVFYWLVLRPAIRAGALPPQVSRFTAVEFGQLVILAMWTLVVTGAILLFTRLSEPTATLPYGVVLGVKIALSAWMFFLAQSPWSSPSRERPGELEICGERARSREHDGRARHHCVLVIGYPADARRERARPMTSPRDGRPTEKEHL